MVKVLIYKAIQKIPSDGNNVKPHEQTVYEAESVGEKIGTSYRFLSSTDLNEFAEKIINYGKYFEVSYQKPFDLKIFSDGKGARIENLNKLERSAFEKHLKQ